MKKHVTLIGVLHIVWHGLAIVFGLAALAVLTAVGRAAGDPEAAAVLGIIGSAVAAFMIALSVPGIVAGAGLLGHRPWARILALIVGSFDLLCIPFGTALGIYTIWALMHDDTIDLFERGTERSAV